MRDEKKLRPVCFMVMPFRKKKVPATAGEGAPSEIDCDALWDKAYRPAIEKAGYTPPKMQTIVPRWHSKKTGG